MRRKKEPKNKNITVRVTENQYRELNKIANSHNLSVSEWANYVLSEHKNTYRKRGKLEKLIEDVDLTNVKAKLALRLLKKFRIYDKPMTNGRLLTEITQLNLAIQILDMTTFSGGEDIDELIRNYHL